jgi:hypothetical protein
MPLISIRQVATPEGSEFGVPAHTCGCSKDRLSNFSLTLDRLNYQFSRKALRI